MSFLALALLCGGTPASAGTGAANLDFATGTLAGWERQGDAFYVTTASARGPSLGCGVCTSDRGARGRTGVLRRNIRIPPGAGRLQFWGYAARAGAGINWPGDENLDAVLAAPGQRILPKEVWTDEGCQPALLLLPRQAGKPRRYSWDVAAYTGRTLQLVLGDQDDRPGSYLFCSGFRFLPREEPDPGAFARGMARLTKKHRLAPAVRYDSRHFTALSNADDRFTRQRLHDGERIYRLFFDHFRRRGFAVHPPPGRLMVAIFDTQAGFEAYLGRKVSPHVTGMYHRGTDRLVVYDYGRNEDFR